MSPTPNGNGGWDLTDEDVAEIMRESFGNDCDTCGVDHSDMEWHSLGMVCGRCKKHTGNNNQGHYWGFCKVLAAKPGTSWKDSIRELHFCCPDDCELEVPK